MPIKKNKAYQIQDPVLFHNEPGLITKDGSWCIVCGGYLYGPRPTAAEVIWEMVVEWKREQHMVG